MEGRVNRPLKIGFADKKDDLLHPIHAQWPIST
jgi:hypothetical protein